MSTLMRLLLNQSVSVKIERRYRQYRTHGTSVYAALITTCLVVLGWIVFRFESPSWQWVHLNRDRWFAHISATRPRSGDIFRYVTQSIWLILIIDEPPKKHWRHAIKLHQKHTKSYYNWINTIPVAIQRSAFGRTIWKTLLRMKKESYRILFFFLTIISVILFLMCVTQPFEPMPQLMFLLCLWAIAMSIRHMPGRFPIIVLVVMSLVVSSRYFWWRYSTTLVWNDTVSLIFGLLLIFAETYIFLVLILGFFQSIWPLNRLPVPLPEDKSTWPTVDVMIPIYDEDLSVLKPGVFAALGMDWPKDKLKIHILDDGKRLEVKEFAHKVGVNYITRPNNDHAKAGNINHALKQTQGDLVAVFDCDHIPTHSFLQLTVGWFFKDPKLGILQTPHHFFSPDPFERNLKTFQSIPNESNLFYGVIQDGNDLWDATYFCGSTGILRRTGLEEIGGFATESVTEDALTSIILQRAGYTSAYIRIPMAAGLATESLSSHIGQRIRWARGMTQILRLNNPLFGKGLSVPQRICYFNAILHFLSGIPRLIFLTTPVAFLLFHARIIYAPALMVLLYATPHIIHASLANNKIQGKYRHFLWNEIYETVMAWYISVPTTLALINPHKGKFNVTVKGGIIKESYADWLTARPYIVLLLINVIGLIAAIWRLFAGPSDEVLAVIITLSWVLYNIAILGGALGVDVESRQIRKSHRVQFPMPAALARADGHLFPCMLRNYSDSGMGIELHEANILKNGDDIDLLLHNGLEEFRFPCKVMRIYKHEVGVKLEELSLKQHINFIQCTFGRADTWAIAQANMPEDSPLSSMRTVFALDFQGYLSIIEYTPPLIRNLLLSGTRFMIWLVSFAPYGRIKDPLK